ncbi:MAG: NADH-quinone oxidoreductase subunit B, partial [Deltaproteobacteria bacterium CG_4_10_14_0_2_um_filter_43_8]
PGCPPRPEQLFDALLKLQNNKDLLLAKRGKEKVMLEDLSL